MKTVFLFIVLSFCLLFISCGDDGASSVADVTPPDYNSCKDFVWLENIHTCYADDTGWLPTACTLKQEESSCSVACEGRFGETPLTSTRFVFDFTHQSFEVDVATNLIVSCTK